MSEGNDGGSHDRWARFRFAIIGRLLASPPPRGELHAEIKALSAQTWRHPISGEAEHVAVSTIERWFHAARKSNDPVRTLRRKPRADAGRRRAMNPLLREALRAQYKQHPYWSYQLHSDNLGALVRGNPTTLGPMASYATVRRYMTDQGMFRRKRPRHLERAGVQRAEAQRELHETRSYEATHVHGLWHLDFHEAKRKVLTTAGAWIIPVLLGILDDHSRLACHFQWYFAENATNLIHGLSQAIQKRGLPRALLDDNGSAMTAAETLEGLARLGIDPDHTLPARPEQNGKQETFWSQVEGRLMAMLEGCEDLTLALLNEATQAWVECEYNQKIHSEIGVSPIDRFVHAPSLGRASPSSDALRRAFRTTSTRRQRRSDGTFTLDGVRFEVPSRYRHLIRLTIRYARWDLSCVDLWDARADVLLCAVYPLDKAKNANGQRRVLRPVAGAEGEATSAPPRASGMAPLLRELMEQYAATGLPPAYLPTDTTTEASAEDDGDELNPADDDDDANDHDDDEET